MGLSHILDWQGYDHMLFLLALCCVFTFGDKRWVWLVSAFTISRLLLRQVSDLTLRRAITFLYHQIVLLRPSRGLVLIVSQTSLVLVLVSTSTSVLDFDHLKRHP